MSDKMQTTEPSLDQRPIRLAPGAPEIYVDGYQGASYKDGVIKLNFYSLALDPATNQTIREVVMRMTLSIGTVMQVHAAFGNLLKDLEKASVIRVGGGGA